MNKKDLIAFWVFVFFMIVGSTAGTIIGALNEASAAPAKGLNILTGSIGLGFMGTLFGFILMDSATSAICWLFRIKCTFEE